MKVASAHDALMAVRRSFIHRARVWGGQHGRSSAPALAGQARRARGLLIEGGGQLRRDVLAERRKGARWRRDGPLAECVSATTTLVETGSTFREYSGLLDIPSQSTSAQDLAALSPNAGSESILLPVTMRPPSDDPAHPREGSFAPGHSAVSHSRSWERASPPSPRYGCMLVCKLSRTLPCRESSERRYVPVRFQHWIRDGRLDNVVDREGSSKCVDRGRRIRHGGSRRWNRQHRCGREDCARPQGRRQKGRHHHSGPRIRAIRRRHRPGRQHCSQRAGRTLARPSMGGTQKTLIRDRSGPPLRRSRRCNG